MTSPAAARGALRIDLLGPLVVRSDTEVVSVVGARRRAVLAFLALAAGRPVPATRIVDVVLGGRGDPRAGATLRTYVSKLRADLGPAGDRLRRVDGGHILDVDQDGVDAHRFRHLVAAAHEGRPGDRLDLATQALGLWRGAPLVDLAGTPWGRAEANAFENLRLEAVQTRAGALLDLGDASAAVQTLEAAARDHPHREDLVGLLMIALYSAGRQADALRLYPRTRERLAAELGVEPTPALRDIHRAILGQETDLRRVRPDRPPALSSSEAGQGSGEQSPRSGVARRLLGEALSRPGPRVLLLTGDPGGGKTHLLNGIADEARQRRARVVAARAVEGAPPLTLVGELLDDFGHGVSVELLRSHLGPLAEALLAVAPRTTARLGGDGTQPGHPGRQILAAAVGEWLRTASDHEPLVLVVDDLEHLDLVTARVLADGLTGADGAPCLLVGAARYASLPDAHPLRRLASALRRRGRLDIAPLRALDRSAVAPLAAASRYSPTEVDRLMSQTGGNAFLVTHLLRASSCMDLSDRAGLQASVDDFIRELVSPLPPAPLEVLTAAAALGHRFRLDSLAAAVQTSEEETARLLAPAVELHLVVDTTAGRYRFVHGVVRDALAHRLGPTRSELVQARVEAHRRRRRPLGVRWKPACDSACTSGWSEPSTEVPSVFSTVSRPSAPSRTASASASAADCSACASSDQQSIVLPPRST